MEIKNNPETGVTLLLSLKWDKHNKNFQNELTILWQDIPLEITVHSFFDVSAQGQRINFDFRYNNESHSYKISDSNLKGADGKIPDLRNDTHKLIIKADIDFLEIHEEILIKKEDQSTGKPDSNEETEELENDYPERLARDKEGWVSVTKDLKIEELEIPYIDNDLLLWIHISYAHKTYDGGWLFKYDLFTPDFHPMQLKEGGFTCIGLFDYSQKTGCGNYTTVKFEISDKSNAVHSFRGYTQMENGVIEAIEFMRLLTRFDDWKDYDEMKVLKKSLGKTDIELDKMIASELDGTGIKLG